MTRPLAITVAISAVAILSGCYASTEPATNVGPESATLNAYGTADKGPARSRFEYWIAGSPRIGQTRELRWPGGARGPIAQRVTGLAASSSYAFRVCGYDESDGRNVCAQTRTFTTGAPIKDSAVGGWANSPGFHGDLDAHSGPAGQSASGTVGVQIPAAFFEGSVTCLRVHANSAVVGAVGEATNPNLQTMPATLLVTVVDGGPSANDAVHVNSPQPGSTPPDCASASFGQEGSVSGDVVVNDAP